MTTEELADRCGFVDLSEAPPREIRGAFSGDLLSWAMSRVREGDAWFTVMGNINSIAVAALSGCACIVLCHGIQPDADALDRAKKEGLVLLATELPEYEAVTAFNRAMDMECKKSHAGLP